MGLWFSSSFFKEISYFLDFRVFFWVFICCFKLYIYFFSICFWNFVYILNLINIEGIFLRSFMSCWGKFFIFIYKNLFFYLIWEVVMNIFIL